jgi:hypothetical protein
MKATIVAMTSLAVHDSQISPIPSVSILIPVYKNDGGLDELVRRISATMSSSRLMIAVQTTAGRLFNNLQKPTTSFKVPLYPEILANTTPSWPA